jgi:hypothetical protein
MALLLHEEGELLLLNISRDLTAPDLKAIIYISFG